MRTLHMLHTLDVEPGQVGSTVRNGKKWADAWGQTIELCVCEGFDTGHVVQGTAEVTGIWFGRFKDVPAKLIENEHEVRSRAYSGLLDSMKKAYGDTFNELNKVVVLTYKRLT